MRQTWTFYSAGQLIFGPGAIEQLGEEVTRRKIESLLLVTDGVLAHNGTLARVQAPLVKAGIRVDVFDGGEPEPSFRAADSSISLGRRAQVQAVLGLGGGSNMDLAKITATVLRHGGVARDYVGEDRIPGPVLPLICVPTTAGTGSEVSAATVLTDQENQMKVGILSNYLRPALAVVDPLLTVSCPAKVTADSGIDALVHAIEAFTAIDNRHFPLPPDQRSVYQGKHPLGDCFAEKAIHLIGIHLAAAVCNGQDLIAREAMALAATLGGLAFSNVGVALVHAMEYPVGGALHCSHGAGNGLLLPYVMRFNLPGRESEFARIAELLGDEPRPENAILAVERLRRRIGIPEHLRDLGAQKSQLRGFAEKACTIQRILRVNPRPVTVADIEGIYGAAW